MTKPDPMNSAINTLPTTALAETASEAAESAVAAAPTAKFSDASSIKQDNGYPSRSRSRPAAESPPAAVPSLFLPVLLASLALLGWSGFQSIQLFKERQALQAAYASQQQTVDNAAKLRASLDAIAADTQRLADSGNANAKLLVDELRKRGITISTAPKSGAPDVKP